MQKCDFTFNEKERSLSDLSPKIIGWLVLYVFLIIAAFYQGFIPLNTHMYFWSIFIPVCYIVPRNYYRSINAGDSVTRGGSRLSDIMVFLFISQICVVYLAAVGTMGFYRLYSGWDYGNAWEDKLFGQSQFITDWFLSALFAYQAWLLLFAILHKEFRTMDFLLHHTCVVAGSLISFMPFAQYYVLFSGLTEMTNVVLSVFDAFQYLGDDYKKKYPKLYVSSQALFGLLFYTIRLIYWPIIAYSYFKSSFEAVLGKGPTPVPNFDRYRLLWKW